MKTIQRFLSSKTLNSLMILAVLLAGVDLNAQVTVGSEDAPQPFSLLEVSTDVQKGGLRLPQLTTAERDALDPASNPGEAEGLVIYNKDNDCFEYWNLTEWVSLCAVDAAVTDPMADPANLPPGAGSLIGRACFDIAETNDNIDYCGTLSNRIPYRANFNDPAVNTQVYTFTPSGMVSKVRFFYVESQSGMIVDSFTPDGSYEDLTGISGSCTVTLVYKTNLSSPNPDAPSTGVAVGLTTAQALAVDIYAIYNDNPVGMGADRIVKLTAYIKDCACCGARTDSGGWLNFMCHNLGADESLDPFTHNTSLYGDLYQWGRRADGHEKRTSGSTNILADSNTPGHANFIRTGAYPDDWRSGGGNAFRWGDGTSNENMAKAANDPCPAGWKVPSEKQWASIYTNETLGRPILNTWTWTGNGYKVGDALYLPAAGTRSTTTGSLSSVGSTGCYWSSTAWSSSYVSCYMYFNSTIVDPSTNNSRAYGRSVRCVQDDNATATVDPATLPPGAGSLAGKTCFDIAETNNNIDDCGALISRVTIRDNFNDAATNTQVYTFTPSETVSKVRFVYVESQSGMIVDSFTPGDSYENMTDISNSCTVTLIYKTNLSSPNPNAPSTGTALGLTTAQALTVDVYAIYNDNADGKGTDRAVKLTASIKDCACCGAKTNTDGWLTFMCHNLGADESLDPFTHNEGLYGDFYQWGRPADGHEKRNSGTTSTLADSNTPGHANFITVFDWRSGGGNDDRWGDGTSNEDMPKAANDPCPTGWKVPSQKQWASIYTDMLTPNTWTWMGNGYKVGDALYLPAAGYRNTAGTQGNLGSIGYYWSSTVGTTNSYSLFFYSSGVNPANTNPRGNGLSVRCVQDDNAIITDPAALPVGVGSLKGKIYFDIAETNDNIDDCGALISRKTIRNNFNDAATNTQVYTFTPSGTVSKVRFVYVESQSGVIVDSFTPDDSYENMTDISGSCTATLIYKSSLSSPNPDAPSTGAALGLTTAQALTVDIYAIYNNNAAGTGIDCAVKLTASIKDCACCGAKTASGEWLTFMCYNLGADESLDPFTHDEGLYGDLYQWGRPTDGHEKRTSGTTSTLADSNTPGHADFITASASPNDWRSGGNNTSRWGDGTSNEDMPKAANDPCPAGWKVPSQKQWASIRTTASTPNTWTWTGNGYKVGDALYLPAAGRRLITGLLSSVSSGDYWSSSTSGSRTESYYLALYSSSVNTTYQYRGVGMSVRCVQEN